ncbi:MAG: AAA family ATPase [Syntrophaceae bacterium]|nr:AAA family ATPase [Syntrophaceae bacterium]
MYKEYYRFSEEPFGLHPDPKFLYLAMSHYKALTAMMSGIKEKKGLILVTGEVGGGKTILIHALLKDLSKNIKTAFIFNPRFDFKSLLKTILLDLELPIDKKEESVPRLLEQFKEYLQARAKRDEMVVIIIDEAQGLEDDVLEEVERLSALVPSGSRVLQILLVGQPELETKLNLEKFRVLRGKIAVHSQITPLTREEGRGYIKHRLKLVGRNASEVFTSEAMKRVWHFAGGIPRVMNLICDRALLIGYSNSGTIVDSKIIDQAIQDYDYLQPGKPAFRGWGLSRRIGYAMILGLFILIGAGAGGYFLLHRDSAPPEVQFKGKILPAEERSAQQREIKPIEVKEVKKELPAEKPAELKIPEPKPAEPKPSETKMAGPRLKEEVFAVQEGWVLSMVAQKYYSALNLSLLDFFLEANPEITNLDLIYPGQKIKIPNLSEESHLWQVGENTYQVYLGTFRTTQEAQPYKNDPALANKTLKILKRQVSPQETWYRVLAGDFRSREEALKSIQALKAKKLLPLLDCLPKKTAS